MSGCQMFQYLKGGLKTRLKSLFMVQNVKYSNGQPSHTAKTFEYQTPKLSGIQMLTVYYILLPCLLSLCTYSDVKNICHKLERSQTNCCSKFLLLLPLLLPTAENKLLFKVAAAAAAAAAHCRNQIVV